MVLQKLDTEHLDLFLALLWQPQEKTALLTSREERKLVRAISGQLEAAGIENSRQVAFFLVQLGAVSNWQKYLPLLCHPESEFILATAYSLHAIDTNTGNINLAVDRISKIIYALKSFIRQGDSNEATETNVVEGMETVLTIYHNQIKQNTELIKQFDQVPLIMAYPDELNQVWTNLIHNALQAMEYKGTLTISIRSRDDMVVVSVSDTGCGIPKAHREKIFDAFFTTKKRGEGSGLGLDIVKKIIQKHGGSITLESTEGKGTTFYVSLPTNRMLP
jgi:signal transduction histidine kinase